MSNLFWMRSTVLQSSAAWKLWPAPAGVRGHVALGEVALAPAVVRGVDGDAERRVAVDGARDMIVTQASSPRT